MSSPLPDTLHTNAREAPRRWCWGYAEIGCALIGILFFVSILLPPLGSTQHAARQAACLTNLKQLGAALKLYAADYDDRLPPAHSWTDSLGDRIASPRILACPEARNPFGYAFHQELDAARVSKIPDPGGTPVLYDSSTDQPNAAEHGESFVRRHPLGHSGNVLFADGHAKRQSAFPHRGAP